MSIKIITEKMRRVDGEVLRKPIWVEGLKTYPELERYREYANSDNMVYAVKDAFHIYSIYIRKLDDYLVIGQVYEEKTFQKYLSLIKAAGKNLFQIQKAMKNKKLVSTEIFIDMV